MTMSLYPDRSIIPRGDLFSLSTFHFHFGYSVSTLVLSCSGTFQYVTLSMVLYAIFGLLDIPLSFADNIPFIFLHTLYFYHCFLFGLAFSARDFHSMHSVPYIERLGAKYMPAIMSLSAEANQYHNKTTVPLQTSGDNATSSVYSFIC
jgi:hypothetical protein